MDVDVIVLGAGIVGVSVAVHLQRRGRSVALVERREEVGLETSFGNLGLIQREGVIPYAFPRDWRALAGIAGNRRVDVRYRATALPGLLPFLVRYWRSSHPRRHALIARAYEPLIRASLDEHRALAAEAGAGDMIRPGGWLAVFRTGRAFETARAGAEAARAGFGVAHEALDAAGLGALEPHLATGGLAGALRWTDAASVADPGALTLAYRRLFERLGGRVLRADANDLAAQDRGWIVPTARERVRAPRVVVALGPWSDRLTRRLGYRLPLAVKRGYHRHYRTAGNAGLNLPVLDAEIGYALAPMRAGIRLTTGAQFAAREAPRDPAQIAAAEPLARGLLPALGEAIEAEPWMGARPCTSDMLPVIGPAPRHRGLWFAFGHAHHGLTLGPATGRLIAEMVTGERPFVDPRPYRADRF